MASTAGLNRDFLTANISERPAGGEEDSKTLCLSMDAAKNTETIPTFWCEFSKCWYQHCLKEQTSDH